MTRWRTQVANNDATGQARMRDSEAGNCSFVEHRRTPRQRRVTPLRDGSARVHSASVRSRPRMHGSSRRRGRSASVREVGDESGHAAAVVLQQVVDLIGSLGPPLRSRWRCRRVRRARARGRPRRRAFGGAVGGATRSSDGGGRSCGPHLAPHGEVDERGGGGGARRPAGSGGLRGRRL